ncbi:thioredoxin family protein [Georgenia sp. AZ-5]|uniref:thioredoxin family protein n=1 Tax=Georgenia sp. AZ-5 TaxID=3367526 RepID=UPI003753E9DB
MVCPSRGRKNRVPVTAAGRPRCPCHGELPWVVDVASERFAEAVERAEGPCWWTCGRRGSGPCRQVSPVLDQLVRERAGRLKLAKVNADLEPDVVTRHQIRGIPTLLLYRGGREVSRVVGAQPASALRRWLDEQPAEPAGPGRDAAR